MVRRSKARKKASPLISANAPVRKHISDDDLLNHDPPEGCKILRSVPRPNYCEDNLRSKVYHSDGSTVGNMCSELEASSQDNHGYGTRSKDFSGDQKKCEATTSNEKMALTDSEDIFSTKDDSISNGFFDLERKPKKICKKGTAGKDLKIIKNEPTSANVKSSSEGEKQACPICQEEFPDNHAFTLHIREHNTSNNNQSHVCKLCFKKLSSASSLDRHSYVHSKEKPFSCAICNTNFTTNGNMNRHMRTHEKRAHSEIENNEEVGNLKKKVCLRNAEVEKEEEDEEMTNPENRACKTNVEISFDTHYCQVCTKRFISEESLQIHMDTHQNVVIECRTCFEKYTAQKNHVCKLRVNEVKTNTVVGFRDLDFIAFSANKFSVIAKEKCEEQARSSSSFILAFECHVCSKAFPCERSLQIHELTHDVCSVCECPFSSSKCIHNSMHKPTQDTNESDKDNFLATLDLKKVTSSTASESSTSQNLSKDEILRENPSDRTTKIEEEEENKMNSDTKQNVQSESSNDFADIPDIISRTSNATLLNIRTSPAAANTIVSGGDAMRSNTESLIIEKSNSNMAEASFGGNASSSRDSDENNDDPNNKRHKCKHCSLCFETMKALRGHARCHSQNGPHCCGFCTYKSVDKSTLLRHMRTHNGERPFKCDLCDYAFTTKANSYRHVKKKHKIPDDQVASFVVYNPNMLDSSSLQAVSNNKDETICRYCGKDYRHSRLLKHHVRSKGCREKPFTCRRCHFGFSTKNNCIRHISTKHPEENVSELIIARQASASNHSDVSYSGNNEAASTEEDEPSNLCIVDSESDNLQEQSNQGDVKEEMYAQEDVKDEMHAHEDVKEEMHAQEVKMEANENEQEKKCNVDESTPEKPSSDVSSNLSDTFINNYNEEVGVAFSLIDLSEMVPFQVEPMDLSVRAIDLSSKNVYISQEKSNKLDSQKNLNSLAAESETYVEPPPAHSTPVMTKPLAAEHPLSKFILPMNSIQYNSNEFLTCQASPVTALPLLYVPQSMAASSSCTLNNAPSSSALYVSSAVCLPSNDEANPQNACMSQMKMVKKKLIPNEQSYKCDYCNKKFTLKSNRERHVKKQHPEFARPARSRNFIPFLQEDILKPLQNVSDTTKKRLRFTLKSKVNCNNGNRNEDVECTMDLRDESVLAVSNENTEVEKNLDLMDQNSRNDFENSDLASVPSLIHTANSQFIKEYFRDVSGFTFQSSPEKVSSSESELEDSKSGALSCEHCKSTFRWASALDRHMRTHTGSKPYRCSGCPVKFSTKSNRDRHLKKQCCDKPTYRCWKTTKGLHNGQCSKQKHPNSKTELQSQCNIENNLNSHEMTSNDMNRPHVVDQQENNSLSDIPQNLEVICSGATLSTVAHVASLRYQSLNKVQQELECKVCQNTYKSNDDLTNHMKELHLLEYKKLVGERVDPPSDSIIPWKKSYSAKKDHDQSFRTHNKPASPDSGTASIENESDPENNLISNLLGVNDPKVIDELIDCAARTKVEQS